MSTKKFQNGMVLTKQLLCFGSREFFQLSIIYFCLCFAISEKLWVLNSHSLLFLFNEFWVVEKNDFKANIYSEFSKLINSEKNNR